MKIMEKRHPKAKQRARLPVTKTAKTKVFRMLVQPSVK